MRGLLTSALLVALTPNPSSASAILDFSTGSGGSGGTLTIGTNISGTDIFIDTLTVTGAGVNGVFDVEGTGACADAGGCGLLNFNRDLNTISIVGAIPALGLVTPVALLTGNLSQGVSVLSNDSTFGSVSLRGLDTKAPALLEALAVSPPWTFSLFGVVTGVDTASAGSPYEAISTDIANAVPDGGSTATLLGLAMIGVAYLKRRCC
jgi:hypothetical protein